MNVRERIEAVWAGEQPDRIPITLYEWLYYQTGNDPAWQPLFDKGLGFMYHIPTVVERYEGGVEKRDEEFEAEGIKHKREIWRTPVGEISQVWAAGWRRKHLIETREDYRVMTYIARHTRLEPCYREYEARVAALRPWEVPTSYASRTPMQQILVDYVGLENFALHLYDFEDEIPELYAALLEVFARRIDLVAGSRCRYVAIMENFSAETMGPRRFSEFHLPLYREYFPILQQAGKIVGTHFDGKLAVCRDLIANAPIDVIESLTPPPEGDMTLAECRTAWPDKHFWVNLNVSAYELPPDELRACVRNLVRQAAPDGRRLAFEISEDVPPNWKVSVPIVLDVLLNM